jgi:hypothetical protein
LNGTSATFSSKCLLNRVQVGTAATINDATGVGNTLQLTNYASNVFVTGSADNYIYKSSSFFGGLIPHTLIFQTRSDVAAGGFAFVAGSTPSASATISYTGAATFSSSVTAVQASIGYTTAAPTNGLIVNGNVGIGTASPASLLYVKGDSLYNGIITADNSSTTGGGVFIVRQNGVSSGFMSTLGSVIGNTSRDLALFSETGLNINFHTNDTERLRITSAGNVGIGTTTPDRLLHVVGAIRITGTAAPSSPAAGDQYFDSGTNRMRFRDGTDSWIDMGMFWESAAW